MLDVHKTPSDVAGLHSFHPDVLEATTNTYDQIREMPDYEHLRLFPYEAVHKVGVCDYAASLLVWNMKYMGYQAHIYEAEGTVPYLRFHQYIGMRSSRGVILLDPTWMITLGDNLKPGTKPYTLVGTRNEVKAAAITAGMLPDYAHTWDRSFAKVIKPADYAVPQPRRELLVA